MEKDQLLPASVTVSDDKMLAIITIGQATYKVDAKVLSEFLASLMVARATILPPVPRETPDTTGLSVRTASWGVATDVDNGDVILGLPHPGFGWIGYRFSKQGMQHLVHQLAVTLQNMPAAKAH